MKPFNITLPSKWILTGEHSVLRGKSALVFPNFEKTFSIQWQPANQPLSLDCRGHDPALTEILFQGLLQAALRMLNQPIDLKGKLQIMHKIPIGTGLGFSACLSVAITRWLIHLGHLNEVQCFEFSKGLEDQCHGESSGLDVAAVFHATPLEYTRHSGWHPVQCVYQPYFTLHDSKIRNSTQTCIEQVHHLMQQQPEALRDTDCIMQRASDLAKTALTSQASAQQSIAQLTQAIQMAHDCFQTWHLIPSEVSLQIDQLYQEGAVAVKPTGSGLGGMLLALWPSPPKTYELITLGSG